ncbi:MAG: cytochrome P450 [Rubrobacteraceae bacterium]
MLVFGARDKSGRQAGPPGDFLMPPGPEGSLLTGNLLDYTRDHLGFLTWCAREYGDVTRLRFVNVPVYLLNHPDHIEYVLVRNNRNFIKSRGERVSLGFLGQGLLTSEGSFWRRQRRLAQPAFHRERVAAYGEVMVESAERMVATWRDGEARDVHRYMMRLTLEIVAKTLFGVPCNPRISRRSAALWPLLWSVSQDGEACSFRYPRESQLQATCASSEHSQR